MEYGLRGLVILIANVYSHYHVIDPVAFTGSKVAWTISIVVLPVHGFIAWLNAGTRSTAATA